MPAGPYPTKAMHNALKGRVSTLENASGGGGGSAAPLFVGLPSMGLPTAPLFPLFNIRLQWQRRSVSVAGFRLAGTVPADVLAGVSLQRGTNGNEAVSAGNNLTLTRVDTTIDGQAYTDYLFDRSYVATDTTLNISFTDAQQYPVSPVAQVALAGVINPDGGGFPFIEILSDQHFEVPLVPVPTPGDHEPFVPQLSYTEVVWPASDAPYLHVFKADSDGIGGSHYHVPLTAGLPV
ncbi:hypothetical protein [Deinococcus humi]|uniref:Uncharacterized protein n=1 Tax=Deinococcus humi TaxID=662880 RepID=A0A7W8JS12_9DEIO|nr:hypothetical protein [Deinococcus humi]MBB5362059.1 hypothetical protein [Deinococcus humi]GGO22279.1 hypothetical protein GCM10008949_09360 [Deinococcus humi]